MGFTFNDDIWGYVCIEGLPCLSLYSSLHAYGVANGSYRYLSTWEGVFLGILQLGPFSSIYIVAEVGHYALVHMMGNLDFTSADDFRGHI